MRTIGRADFVAAVRRAIADRTGFAAGKLGTSEKIWMYYEVLLASNPDDRHRLAFEAVLKFHAGRQSGLFPTETAFLREFNRMYVSSVRDLDCVGLFHDRPDLERAVIEFYGLTNDSLPFMLQEPDRSSPARDDECYLPALRGRRVLLVAPFADLLKARATREIFESVWARTGKRWFAPAAVEAFTVPYGFDADTARRFGTSLALLDRLAGDLALRDFDVALIAAGGLAIPMAAAIKRLGRVAISLGGHLQVLFGVAGKRWRDSAEWQTRYINAAWIDMPPECQPRTSVALVADAGAYW